MFSDFATPQWLLAGSATVITLALAMVYADRRRRRALRAFAAATPISTVSPARRWLRNALALVGVAMAFVALARPRGGYTLEHTPRQGLDLVFAVDTSKSMRAADLAPDRLTRAKLAVTDLVRKFQGERVGLIAFAGGAFVQAPMTADHNVFLEALQSLDTDVIPRPGTDISSAIRAARQAMASEPANRKLLILVSDGESLTGDALAAAREAAKEGIRIFTVGVGTARGELIETVSPDGASRELIRDEQGNPVRSKLDETMLRSIAQVTGGQYEPLGADGRGLDRLYERSLSTLPKAAGTTTRKVYKERYQFPLAIALACLLLELLIRDRKNPRRRSRSRSGRAAAVAAVTMLAIPAVASAEPVKTYNEGTEAYRHGDFEAAQKQFDGALHTKDVGLQEDAYYNLGNARYRVGERALKTDKSQAMEAWKSALAAYDAALALQPDDQDAKFNRDLVARKIAALEAEQKQQPQQGGSKGNQQSGSQGQQQSGSQGQQQSGSRGQQQSDSQGQQNGSQGQQQSGSQGQQNGSQGQQQSGSQGQQQSGSQGQQQSGSQGQQNGSQGQQQSGSQGQQQSGSQGQQQSGSQGQHQNGSQDQQQQSSSSDGSSSGQRQNGSSNGSSPGQRQNSSSNGSSPGQHQNGSSNGQQQDGSSNGQQSKSASNGQQSNGKQRNNQQTNGRPNDQQANSKPDHQQANNEQANGQPNNEQANGQPNHQHPNGQPNNQQPNGQPNYQQPNGQPDNQQANTTSGSAADNPSSTEAERQTQAARVHAPDAAASNGNSTSAATAGNATDGAPTTAAERAADNARRAAGQLTRREALLLLDAAEHELKPMPIDGKARAADRATTTTRDW